MFFVILVCVCVCVCVCMPVVLRPSPPHTHRDAHTHHPSHTRRYFVIQGSSSLEHWQINLQFEPLVFEDERLGVRVHRGVYEVSARGVVSARACVWSIGRGGGGGADDPAEERVYAFCGRCAGPFLRRVKQGTPPPSPPPCRRRCSCTMPCCPWCASMWRPHPSRLSLSRVSELLTPQDVLRPEPHTAQHVTEGYRSMAHCMHACENGMEGGGRWNPAPVSCG